MHLLPELGGVLRAVAVWSLFLLLPGYAIAWFFNLFEFRAASGLRRLAVSIPLSISTMPILVYWCWRFGSIRAVWWMCAALWFLFLIAAAKSASQRIAERPVRSGPRVAWVGVFAIGAWVALGCLVLLDLRWGDSLYFPVTAYDYRTRIPMAASLALSPALPPLNPFLNPGHPLPLIYHYLWPMMCAVAALAARGAVTVRQAVIAGTLWSGAAFFCLIALYLRFFLGVPREKWKTYALGFALVGVSGLDILPVLAFDAATVSRWHRIHSTVESWNEQITGWLDAMLWVPHDMAALVAVFTAFLLMWRLTVSSPSTGNKQAAAPVLLAAAGLASATGMSIYVALVFAAFVVLWTLHLSRNWARSGQRREAALFAGMCVLALAFAAPFLLEVAGTGNGGRFPIKLGLRPFGPLQWITDALGRPSFGWRLAWRIAERILRLALLPLNYFLELGVFFYAGFVQWSQFRKSRTWQPQQSAAVLMIVTSAGICTFFQSSVVSSNDLGWRGFMIAQFVFLLWTAQILSQWNELGARTRRIFVVLVSLGACTAAYDVALLRFYMPLLDTRPNFVRDEIDPDARLGRRTAVMAQAYAWMRDRTPAAAIVQTNPGRLDYPFGIYAERRTAVNYECNFSGESELCSQTRAFVEKAFADRDGFSAVCEALPLDFIVATDLDPVWQDRTSWVWRRTPVYANDFARIFSCDRDPP